MVDSAEPRAFDRLDRPGSGRQVQRIEAGPARLRRRS